MDSRTTVKIDKATLEMLRTIKRANGWDTYDTTLRNILKQPYEAAQQTLTPRLRRPG